MIELKSRLKEMELRGKKVFLRVDMNVPLRDGVIVEDYRLQRLRPTLDYVVENGGKVLLASHIGRPKREEVGLSARVLVPWFIEMGYKVELASTLEQARELMARGDGIVLLENLRFFDGELGDGAEFAKELREMTEVYVSDAFGTLHRGDTSVARLPYLYGKEDRTIGFLIEEELSALNKLLDRPKSPFVMILGGGKVTDKVPLIKNLLPLVDAIALCPALAFTFLRAFGYETGRSLVDEGFVDRVRDLVKDSEESGTELLLPNDFVVESDGSYSVVEFNEFGPDTFGLSIGPGTVEAWEDVVAQAGTIFINGLPGIRPESRKDYNRLLKSVAESDAYSVIGGGDSVGAALGMGLEDKVDYLSTGGGATLTYLSGEMLPGLQPFE